MSLKNKVVIVTGASSGIGAALAAEALRQGAKVAAVGRNAAKLKRMVDDCMATAGATPLVITADVTKEDGANDIIKKTVKEYGKIDVLVNNAGFGRAIDINSPTAMAVYDEMMATNIRAVVHLTQLAIPHLAKTKGNIINISSVAALKPFEGMWAYCTSKAALDHFSRCMALELAPKGIRVNVVNPGPVKTDFHVNMGLSEAEIKARAGMVTEMTLLKRYSQASETADLIVFLASDKACGITGSSYVTDNGLMMK